MGALLPRQTDEPGATRKSLHGAPGTLKAFFDRTAERGITLPNEQAQSRGISLCSGCSVAAAACLLGTSCVVLFGDLVLSASIDTARTFSSPL